MRSAHATQPQPGQSVRADGYTVAVVEHDAQGVFALRFVSDDVPGRSRVHLLWGIAKLLGNARASVRPASVDSEEKLPALRPLEITPFTNENNEPYFAVHDHARIAKGSLAVSLPGYFVMAHLDGQHSWREVSEAFLRQFGRPLAHGQIERLVATLDEALMLENERFERAYTAQQDVYLAAPARKSRDGRADPAALRAEIEQMLARGSTAPAGDVRGIIAPHLDYRRGAPCYADAYGALMRAGPAKRYVILGTNHAGRASSVVATRKDFQTPLGLVRTDREFIGRVEKRLGASICADEFDHQLEHSIELQVNILQVCAAQDPSPALKDGAPIRFAIVPVLCPDPCGGTEEAATGERQESASQHQQRGATSDGQRPSLAEFADALGELIANGGGRTVVIAAADLSHVGQRFGDARKTTPEFLEAVGRRDRELLTLLEQRREVDFLQEVCAAGNPTRICSVGCIYAALRALPDLPCRVLAYHQAVDFAAETHVTCAAAVIG